MPTQPSTKIKQVRSLVDSGMSSPDARRSVRLNPTIPPVIPSTALAGNKTFEDVMDTRADLEQTSALTSQFNSDFSSLTGRIGNTKLESPFRNPEEFLNRQILRGTTETQMALDAQRQAQATGLRNFADEQSQAGTDARQDLGINDLQANLAETRTRRAERAVKLREDLRNYEENAQKTGMVREAFEGQKAKLQSDAATELADLAIIESAQLGNLQEARAEVDSILAEKRQSFEFENQAIQAEIERLNAMDTRESEARSEQLQIALEERNRNIETQLANEKEQREYLVQAAAEGADQGTLLAIRNATSPEQAAFLAGPWIGKMDRRQAEASIANTYSQIADRQTRLELAREAAMLDEATAQAAGMDEDEAAVEKALGMFSMVKELSTHPGFGSAVGPNPLARGVSPTGAFSAFVSGDRSNFVSLADQIANTLTLENMDKLKGPATDKDVEIVAASVSKLKNRDMSQSDYGKEILKISRAMERIIQNKGATAEQLEFYGIADTESVNQFESLWSNQAPTTTTGGQSTSAIQINTNF